MAATADPQEAAPFFARLPAEVRKLIYVNFWRTSAFKEGSGLRQHVFLSRSRGREACLTHAACMTADPGAPDVRYGKFRGSKRPQRMRWQQRLRSEWNAHWDCEESRRIDADRSHLPADLRAEIAAMRRPPRPYSPFLPVLLACKRFYIEGVQSLYESVTFCLTDIAVADKFLQPRVIDGMAAPRPSRVDLSVRMTVSLIDFYLSRPGEDTAIIVGGTGTGAVDADEAEAEAEAEAVRLSSSYYGNIKGYDVITRHKNVWERVCEKLAALPSLRALRVWVDTKDLRPWHRSVIETRLFERLLEVGASSTSDAKLDFKLCLPLIPEKAEERDLLPPGSFFEGPRAGAFALERGERPDNWKLHLSARSSFLAPGPMVGGVPGPLIPSFSILDYDYDWVVGT